MDSILSIQSHVVYGYVGNKAATYPLQNMGYDVWPINSVQFSNHTGYGKFEGEVFSAHHIQKLADGIFAIDQHQKCKAILSGYMGSLEICQAVTSIVKKFKKHNTDILYLCDPVIGDKQCYVKSEVLDFFKSNLHGDIISPNQYEAEVLSGIMIKTESDLDNVADYFRKKGISIVVITGVKLDYSNTLFIYGSDGVNKHLVKTPEYQFKISPSGTGDLFSSVFLGMYLKERNLSRSIKDTVTVLDEVLLNTLNAGESELQILSTDYRRT